MIIAVASGKGGTGKTTVATSLVLSIENAQLLDCDVEEPNAHIFLNYAIDYTEPVRIPVPVVDAAKCTACGRCKEACVYNALALIAGRVLVFAELCHGCGACTYVCPVRAIREDMREVGTVRSGHVGALSFADGTLSIGEAMAPPVIKAVKHKILRDKNVIIDAPPGTSCPVISAMRGADFCLLVTEPTPFGLHDLKLAIDVVRTLNIPCGVVINRADLGSDDTERHLEKEKVPVLMKIPFSKDIASAYSQGTPLVTAFPEYKEKFKQLFDDITKMVINSA